MRVSRSTTSPIRRVATLLLAALVLAALAGPGAAVGSGGDVALQQETETEGTAGDGTADGASQAETGTNGDDGADSDGEGEGATGPIGTAFGFVGGLVGAIVGFLDSPIGHALVGIPLGIYLGLKAIALYLEYYE